MKAKTKMHCAAKNGQIGCFLTDLDSNELSPIFDDYVDLIYWMIEKYPNRKQISFNSYEL